MATGLARSSDGALWLNGAEGTVRVSSSEVSAALREASHSVIVDKFSQSGHTGPAVPRTFGWSMQVGAKGRVWFVTLSGIVSIAPGNIKPSEPPPLLLRSVLADGAPLPTNRTLPAGVNTLIIRYVGINFSDPFGLS